MRSFFTSGLPDLLRGFGGFFGALQGFDSLGRKADLHAVNALGLQVDLESPAGSDVGVAAGVPSLGSATGQFTNAAHMKS